MKLVYDWRGESCLDVIKLVWPAEWKRYLMKWAKLRANTVREIMISICPWTEDISIRIMMNGPRHLQIVRFQKNMLLEGIAEIERLGSKEELCVMLDLKDVA